MRWIAMITVLLLAPWVAAQPAQFHEDVDLTEFSTRVAVWTDGRVKSYETFARSFMPFVAGPRAIDGQDATFTLLDMALVPDSYSGRDIIYVKNKQLRAAIAEAVAGTSLGEDQVIIGRLQAFKDRGLISREMLTVPAVTTVLTRLRRDVMRFAHPVEAIEGAMAASDPRTIRALLLLVPPAGGDFDAPWSTLDDLGSPMAAHVGLDRTSRTALSEAWTELGGAWRTGDAASVNAQLERLAGLLPALGEGSAVYPGAGKLWLESWYFRLGNLTWIWIIYLMAIVLLLMAFVYGQVGSGRVGLGFFIVAAMLHTTAIGWRWYVSGRWPNANMFEAITTASWMGVVSTLWLSYLTRRRQMRWVFLVGGGVAAMLSLLAVRLYPLELSPAISNKMPVLHDVWLYIHTNCIIFSYCLIMLAAVSAGLYLIRRVVLRARGISGVDDYARAGGAATLVQVRPGAIAGMGATLDAATMILVEVSFILLWAGIAMGAIWADHSWGRPWGWDPKEVFALNTFLVFAVLIHTRMKVRDKGLWTAILASIGCAVMLFNWIIINFTISGLHSYA